MNRYGPSIPGLDINRINQFNSDFGDDAVKKQQLQKQQLLKRQQELKKQEELKRLIEIEKQKKLRAKQQQQQNIQQETQRLYKKGMAQPNLGESIHEMKQMESQIQLERMEQQKEFIKRQQEYKPTNDLISDEFPEGHSNTQKLDDKNDEIELRDSEILNTLMEQQMKKEEKEKEKVKVTVTENIDDNQIMLNEGQLNQFKSMVKQWLAYDDEIKVLQNALKDRRAKKNELTPVVMDFMKNHEIEDLNTKDGKLKCYTSNRKKALTQKDIKHKLLGYFKSENKGEKCVEYVFGDREIKEVMNLRRTFKKK